MKPSVVVSSMNWILFIPTLIIAWFAKRLPVDPQFLFLFPFGVNVVALMFMSIVKVFRRDFAVGYRYPFFIAALLTGFIGFPFLCTSAFITNPSLILR